jgi:hypothetical protein
MPCRANGPRSNGFAAHEPFEFVGQVAGGREALRRFFLEALETDRFEVARHTRIKLTRRDRIGVQDVEQRGFESLGHEGRAPCQQVIQHATQAVDIARRSDLSGLPAGLFRRMKV